MDWILIFYLISYLSLPLLVYADLSCPFYVRNSSTYILQACLLNGYDKTVAPTYSNVNASEVTLWIGLKYLSLDNDKIAMYGFLGLDWVDERLAFDSDFYDGQDMVRLPAQKVWIPPFIDKTRPANYQFNVGYAPLIQFSDPTIDFAIIENTGHVYVNQMVSMYGRCEDADFSFYPFDVHNCSCYLSLMDPDLNISGHAFDYDSSYKVYYDIVEDVTMTMHTYESETVFQLNIVFRRHSRMHMIMLHVPVLAYLLFNFISLWLSHQHLMKHILPTASFCGCLYNIHAIGNIMDQSYGRGDIFTMVGDKPMHIILLYRNLMLLSMLVLVANFVASLLNMRRKLLISFLIEHSEIFAKSLVQVEHTENTEELLEDEEEQEASEESIKQEISTKSAAQLTLKPISNWDYIMTIFDVLILSFMAYNFGYLVFLVLHK